MRAVLPRRNIGFLADAEDGSALRSGQREWFFGFLFGLRIHEFLVHFQGNHLPIIFFILRLIGETFSVMIKPNRNHFRHEIDDLRGRGNRIGGEVLIADLDDVLPGHARVVCSC